MIYAFLKSKKEKNILFLLLVFIFLFFIIIRTAQCYPDVNLRAMVISLMYCLGLVLYVLLLSNRALLLTKAFFFNLELYIYLNVLTQILYPNGIYMTGSGNGACWFLGYDNWWFIIFYAAFFFAILHYKITGSFIRSIILIFIIHVSTLITMSGVLLFGVLFMDLMLITGLYKAKIINFKTICLAALIVNIMLIFSYSSGLVFYIVNLLKRPIATLLVRNRIWNITLQEISKSWILGVGRPSPQYRIGLYGLTAGVNAHNMWLEILYESGLIGGIVFFLILFMAGKGINKASDSEAKQLILICILTCFVGLSVDSVLFELRGNMLFVLLALSSNLSVLDENYKLIAKKYYISRKRIRFKW